LIRFLNKTFSCAEVELGVKMSLDDLLHDMKNGAKVNHLDWDNGEFIAIKNGYFVDENGEDFTIAPWMLDDLDFYLKE